MNTEAKYVVRLEAEDRKWLQALVRKGGVSASVVTRARILLKADASAEGPGWTDERIAEFVETSVSTVHRVRYRFQAAGLAAVSRKRAEGRQYRKLDGEQEAQLIALTCSQAPEGRSRWTLRLLAQRLVALEVVDAISHECVRSTLKKTR
jgi:transposase